MADWKTRSEVLNWARVQPSLKGINLKPYLFVIKDRHNYLSNSAALSPELQNLLEKLASGGFNAAGVANKIKSLAGSEIDSLFKALRIKVLGSKSFMVKPPPLEGLINLAKSNAGLQMRYIEVLEELPAEQLGFWAASGHSFIKESNAAEKLKGLHKIWSEKGSQSLKTALATSSKVARNNPRKA